MKRRTTVRLHLRRTKRGPKIVRKHPRLVRAKMAEWESPEEREKVKKQLELRFKDAKNKLEHYAPYVDRSRAIARLQGYEAALEDAGLMGMANSELKQFKRARTARALPIVKIGGKKYFVDSRLNELRNIKNPGDKEKMEASEEWYVNEFGE